MNNDRTILTKERVTCITVAPVLMQSATSKIRSSYFQRLNSSPVDKAINPYITDYKKDKLRICS